MLAVTSLAIQGMGGIRDLRIELKPGLNLICGPNGVGKTTILNCIAQSFTWHYISELRRNVAVTEGRWKMEVLNNGRYESTDSVRINYGAQEQTSGNGGYIDAAKYLVNFKTHRDLPPYIHVGSISTDLVKDRNQNASEITSGTQAHDAKQWFMNRYVWSAHPGLLSQSQSDNLALAKQCFGMLDPKVSFARVVPASHDILVNTPDGEIYFEYLSSGYKSCLFILLALVKEIEFRFKRPEILVADFAGVVLIDELDLHLHPQWQATLVSTLKRLIPKAQIIATTHSAHMIQAANPDEVVPLGFNASGNVCIRSVPSGTYGYQGWTVEEILTDVMGLDDTRSEAYRRAIGAFQQAIDGENVAEATASFQILDNMLHPENPMRKLLRLQLRGIGGRPE